MKLSLLHIPFATVRPTTTNNLQNKNSVRTSNRRLMVSSDVRQILCRTAGELDTGLSDERAREREEQKNKCRMRDHLLADKEGAGIHVGLNRITGEAARVSKRMSSCLHKRERERC